MKVNDTKGVKLDAESPEDDLTLRVNISRYVFSDLQIEAAKLEAQRLPLSGMAARLEQKFGKKFAESSISRALNEFRDSGTANRMYTAFEELRAAHYWEMNRQIQDTGENLDHMRRTIKQMLLDGLWPFSPRLIPDGYFIDEQRRIHLDHVRGNILIRAMQRIINGENPYRVAKEEGLDPGHIYRKFRNPFYKGSVSYGKDSYGKREVFRGKHEALVDPETWDRLQHALDLVEPIPKFGFKQSVEGEVVDPEKIEVCRQVCLLRCGANKEKPLPAAQVAKKVGLSYNLVLKILNDSDYKKVVGEKLWEDAHNIMTDKADILKKITEKRETRNRTKVTLYLNEYGPSLPKQISKGTQLGKRAVLTVLHELKEAGDVDTETGHHRYNRWFLVSQTQTARHDKEPEERILEVSTTPLTFGQIKDKTGLPCTTLARTMRRLLSAQKMEKHLDLGKRARYSVYVKASSQQKTE